MLDFYLERPYVAKPNLTMARAMSIALLVVCLMKFMTNFLIGYWGYDYWIMYSSRVPMFLIDTLFCIFLAIYLNHFGLKMANILLYVKVGISTLEMVVTPVIYVGYEHTQLADVINASVTGTTALIYFVIYLMIGMSLIRNNKDYIGGLKSVGICYILMSIVIVISMAYHFFITYWISSGESIESSYQVIGFISSSIGIFSILSYSALAISAYMCYKKANQHNKWIVSDEAEG